MKMEKGKVSFENEEELLPIAMSLQTTSWNQTGSWKYLEPYYQDLTPPCVHACRVGNDIVTFMRLIEEGRYQEAAKGVLEHNPFPATLGRVCPHPCETPCNRKALGGAIAIQSAERFLGDYAIAMGLIPDIPASDKGHVTVVGAGPAGLSAAYFLRKLGYKVTVMEGEAKIGGLLWTGIPPFRLPRTVLHAELQRFHRMGITFQYGAKLGEEVTVDSLRTTTDALLLAVGLGSSRALGIAGEDHPQVVDGMKMLKLIHKGKKPELGHRISVIGGGNTAVDCARSLLRLGHEVTILYRRTKTEMPAFKEEVAEAIEEGIKIEFLTAPSRAIVNGSNTLVGLECIRMKLGEMDASKRRRPVPIEGSEFVVETDAVVKALGEILAENEIPTDVQKKGSVVTKDYQTPSPGVFACGDCLGDGGTVAQAIAGGREAAYAIHAFLSGTKYEAPDLLKARSADEEIAKYKQFNTAYFQKEAAVAAKFRPVEERTKDFEEVRAGLGDSEICREAARCFKCGTCNLCDNCRMFCPDNAIQMKPDGSGYMILCEYCKGCMACVEECPRAAIHMRRVEA